MKKERFLCSRDGLAVRGHAWGDPDSRHAVILCHGFLANELMCRTYARLLAGEGLLAVTFDFCGGGVICRSGGRLRDMTVLTEKADLLAVIGAVKEKYAPEKISLLGLSQGGFVSGLVAAELGEIEKLIMFYPAVCIPDDARSGKMMFYRFDPGDIPPMLGKFPVKLGGDYARAVVGMDPYKELSGFDGPVLLVHGTRDAIVNIRYARRLKDVYADCLYREIGGAGHVFRGRYDRIARALLLDFMQ
ncbi:MAG: alpha/beta hydrolase [Clostridia bacterium]|nr:alpha/beta hydrolase [Clostridia bacterium]